MHLLELPLNGESDNRERKGGLLHAGSWLVALTLYWLRIRDIVRVRRRLKASQTNMHNGAPTAFRL